MLLRRLLVGGPLAILVAVLAHVAGFGFAHAPGTGHALDLAIALGSAFATLGCAVVLRGFARGRGPTARSTVRLPFPALLAKRTSVAELSAFAALAFVAIEALEGNLAFGESLRAIAALVPFAILVAWLAPQANRKLVEIGISLRTSFETRRRDGAVLSFARESVHVFATSQCASSRRRGRAPPLTA